MIENLGNLQTNRFFIDYRLIQILADNYNFCFQKLVIVGTKTTTKLT